MAAYSYDESGNMALYFVITFLFMILVPLTLSARPTRASQKHNVARAQCECGPCVEHRKKIKALEGASWRKVQFTKKAIFLVVGWIVLIALSIKVSYSKTESSVYDPYEILGLRMGSTEKEIKKHYKKMSLKFHPDKVKLAVNQTIEEVSSYFVDLTKAYKSLTDPEIRKNLEEYGHPDGRQEVSMGIALPKWIVEAQNNIWVLAAYGLIFGGALPAMVYNWWFGSRQKTKDGVFNDTAAAFFKAVQETSEMPDVVRALGQAAEWNKVELKSAPAEEELKALESQIKEKLDEGWTEVRSSIPNEETGRVRALILLHAHLLRLPVQDPTLQALQARVVLNTPSLLNAYLNISAPRNWLAPMLAAMRLQAYLAQAVAPGLTDAQARIAQLPVDEKDETALQASDIAGIASALKEKGDAHSEDVSKVADRWGRAVIADAAFKVIGEKTVTPSALIHLVVKLRLVPTSSTSSNGEVKSEDAPPMTLKEEEAFLQDPKDAEDMPAGAAALGAAHAPHWPGQRKPSWWIILADPRQHRAVIPPQKITDIPFGKTRAYKLKFNGPPGTGVFPWRVMVVSDTFIGEDVSTDITLRVEEVSEGQDEEDEISDPEEDTLAGQMAAMRGGKVKPVRADESDDESTTDDDGKGADSSSDSDSD
ncbi:hypothetical protein PENSPDRAFT_657466 [Peniophora sp. CONT]|nr:hypothetical protein PENSPDRAFT_657466 [Peniophora sp. CONT]